jgi:hypothetical protein
MEKNLRHHHQDIQRRASPPRHTKEIIVKPFSSRVVRPLFQVTDIPMRGQPAIGHRTGGGLTSGTRNQPQVFSEDGKASTQDRTCENLSTLLMSYKLGCARVCRQGTSLLRDKHDHGG